MKKLRDFNLSCPFRIVVVLGSTTTRISRPIRYSGLEITDLYIMLRIPDSSSSSRFAMQKDGCLNRKSLFVALSNSRWGAITSTHSISILAKRWRRDTLISSGLTISTFSYAWQSSASSLIQVFSLGSMSPNPKRKSDSGRLIVQ